MRGLLPRVERAMRLDATVFEEVEHDHHAGLQCLLVVVLASACSGLGNLAAAAMLGLGDPSLASLGIVIAGFLVAWLAWSYVTMVVGTLLFGGRADMGEMGRALGLAAAPGVVMLVPGLGAVVGIPWSLVAMIIAVRQALDVTTGKALATVAVSAAAMLVLLVPPLVLVAGRI